MRDEIDARIWNEHHDRFSESVDAVLAGAGSALRQGAAVLGRVPAQLFALAAAIGLTALTLGASIA